MFWLILQIFSLQNFTIYPVTPPLFVTAVSGAFTPQPLYTHYAETAAATHTHSLKGKII